MFKLQIHLLVSCLYILPNREEVFKNGFQIHIQIHRPGRQTQRHKWAVVSTLCSPALTTSSPGAFCHRLNPRFPMSLGSLFPSKLILSLTMTSGN